MSVWELVCDAIEADRLLAVARSVDDSSECGIDSILDLSHAAGTAVDEARAAVEQLEADARLLADALVPVLFASDERGLDEQLAEAIQRRRSK